MKYISLFSGIGGFEVAIQNVFPNAKCIGYSEIKDQALNVYSKHFPNHVNLGDITEITEGQIREIMKDGCDLIVAGFPCTNLSSIAGFTSNRTGLDGKHSGLFWDLIRIVDMVFRISGPIDFIVENNGSMSQKSRDIISNELNRFRKIHISVINAKDIGVQSRRRIYWTSFPVRDELKCVQTWDDVLEDKKAVEKYSVGEKTALCMNRTVKTRNASCILHTVELQPNGLYISLNEECDGAVKTRWSLGFISDTMETQVFSPYPVGKCRTLITSSGTNNIVFDRRFGSENEFLIRYFSPVESEYLFGFEKGWTAMAKSRTQRCTLLGNSVVIPVISHILRSFTPQEDQDIQ
jgi:DNA-cytosine methyltransferase